MSSLNKALILGRLGQDPELRYTANQTPVVSLNLATSEYRPATANGEKQEHTEWHRVIVWGRQAENCAKYLKKGRAVFVEGRLQTRSWDDKNGQKRYTTEISASNVQFLPQGGGSGNFDGQTNSIPTEQQGTGGMQATSHEPSFPNRQESMQASSPVASSLDDIPF
tara:strand:+ start:118 stop:615 length:498 start_codon:yes stop_codon:yes gene_type:complete